MTEPSVKLPEDFVDTWVAALRSGDYKQGKSCLRCEVRGDDRWCCLGVVTDLAIKAGVLRCVAWERRDPEEDPDGAMFPRAVYGIRSSLYGHANAVSTMPPEPLLVALGIEPFAGLLASANDRGVSFLDIADTIELAMQVSPDKRRNAVEAVIHNHLNPPDEDTDAEEGVKHL